MARRAHKSSPASAAPDDRLERYRALLAPEVFDRLALAAQQDLPVGVRANPLKVTPRAALADWTRRYAWNAHPVPFCEEGIQVERGGVPPGRTLEFRMGQYYIQDAASMLPAMLFNLDRPAPLLLDLAAAPGGKSTHLAARTGDRGLLVANDTSPARAEALRSALRDWGAASACVTALPGERLAAWTPDTFDGVLLDAPCSMENFAYEGDKKRSVSTREHDQLAGRQARLLLAALHAVRPGGQVVYSTCTLYPGEDEGVLDDLLRRFPGLFRVEEVPARLGLTAPGLHSDGERQFDPQAERALRVWPHLFRTGGFFAARLTRTGDGPGLSAPEPPDRDFSAALGNPATAGLSAAATAWLRDAFGLDLETLQAEMDLALYVRAGRGTEQRLTLVPRVWLERFNRIPALAVGLPLGEWDGAALTPSHEFAARFYGRFTAGIVTVSPTQLADWLRGADLPRPGGVSPGAGTVLVRDEDGRFAGRARVGGEKLKNLLPRGKALAG